MKGELDYAAVCVTSEVGITHRSICMNISIGSVFKERIAIAQIRQGLPHLPLP